MSFVYEKKKINEIQVAFIRVIIYIVQMYLYKPFKVVIYEKKLYSPTWNNTTLNI